MKKLLNLTLAAVLSMAALPMIAGKDAQKEAERKAKNALTNTVYIQNDSDQVLTVGVKTGHKQKKGSKNQTARYGMQPGQVIKHDFAAQDRLKSIFIPNMMFDRNNSIGSYTSIKIGQTSKATLMRYFITKSVTDSAEQAKMRAAASQVSAAVVDEDDADDQD